jgi:hypothetical protein
MKAHAGFLILLTNMMPKLLHPFCLKGQHVSCGETGAMERQS